MTQMLKVSVVIPTKDGGAEFFNTLKALRDQEYSGDIEIVCVDSGSNDDTVSTARYFGAIVKSIPPEEFNHGLTRNLGISLASGEIIIMMSQDAIPGDKYLVENFVRVFSDPKIAGAYARQVPRLDADILTKRNLNNWLTGRQVEEVRWIQDWDEYKKLTPMQRHRFYNFDDVCSAMRKKVWESIPFRANSFGEDIEWAQEVLEAGWKIAYWPYSYVIHSHRRSFKYDYFRNVQTSKKLYEQYRLCLVGSFRQMVFLTWRLTTLDWIYALKNEKSKKGLVNILLRIPFLSFATIYGQYVGFKLALNKLQDSKDLSKESE